MFHLKKIKFENCRTKKLQAMIEKRFLSTATGTFSIYFPTSFFVFDLSNTSKLYYSTFNLLKETTKSPKKGLFSFLDKDHIVAGPEFNRYSFN